MNKSLRDKLLRTRAGYDAERKNHRFLLDAYSGQGGFAGRFADATKADLAGAHIVYCDADKASAVSYLDRYKREDEAKFACRIEVSYYLNYVEALTDLKIAFMLAKEFTAENLPDEVKEWCSNVDGQGMTIERARLRASTRAAIFGWAPTIVDRDAMPSGIATAAQAKDAGVLSPRLTFLFPANLIQWQTDGGELRWVKVRTDHCELVNPLDDEPLEYTRIDVWTRQQVDTYRLPKGSDGTEGPTTVKLGGPRIPIAICRHKEAEEDPVRGMPMHEQVSRVARRIYNLCSELDENLRGFAFPVLVMAESLTEDDDEQKGDDNIVIGVGNALTLNEEAKQKHYYLGPPENIAESLEVRIDNLVREIYRMARTEHVRPAGVADATGIARRYAFAATNAAISSFAANVALWEREVYVLAGRAFGVSEEKLAEIRVVAPTEFDIEDLDAAIKRALDAISASLGATATRTIKSRLVDKVLPDLDDKTKKAIEQELEDESVVEESDAAFGRSAGKPPKPGEKVPPEEDEPDDEEDDEDDA